MAALSTQNIVDVGTAPSFTQASASDTADVGTGRNTFLVYKNTSATPLVLTIVVPGNTSYGQPNPDPQITVPITNGEKWIPLRKEYADDTNRVTITSTGSGASTTVAVVRLG